MYRVVIRICKAQIQCLHTFQAYIGRENETVDDIILGTVGITRVIGLVEQTAGGSLIIPGKGEAFRQIGRVERADSPVLLMCIGIDAQRG